MKETGILCFECKERSGIDCPGRRPDEATRCAACMRKFLNQMDVAEQVMKEHNDLLKRLADS